MPKGTHFTFASLGDLHMREENASSFRDLFAKVSKEASALVLCGDLTDTGTVKQAELLAEELRGCSIPVVAVLGNHDYECGHAEDVKTILTSGGVHLLDGQSCQVDGVSFIGVKGFAGGFGSRMLSSFGEPATKTFVAEAVSEAMRLENALRTAKGPRAVVVLHYSPIAETAEGEPPEIFPFLGCSRLAETIDRFKVSAVVHGHCHRGKYEGRTPGGAPVYNVSLPIKKPGGEPYALISI
jgi:Icc-related predicted phosphoesterase